MFISIIGKKGGVGKSTLTSYIAHNIAISSEEDVCVISMDDQNSIFNIFGCKGIADEDDGNTIDYVTYNLVDFDDMNERVNELPIKVRDNLYFIKMGETLNFNNELLIKPKMVKRFKKIMNILSERFDYVFFDYSPEFNNTFRILVEVSDLVNIVVGMDKISVAGFSHTLQFLYDQELNLDNIANVIPNCFSKRRKASKNALEYLKEDVRVNMPEVDITEPIPELAVIKNLQTDGISIYDDDKFNKLNSYDKKKIIEFRKVFDDVVEGF